MMRAVYEWNGLQIFRYEPKALKPFYIDMEPLAIMRRIRFWIDMRYGYAVYYLKRGEEFLGYCTITSGKNLRYWFASDGDIIVGPYYVAEQHRGHGYAAQMADAVLHHCGISWEKAYAYIRNTNLPSIRTIEKVNGKFLFHVHNTVFRRLVKTDDGEYGVYEVSK